MSDKFVCISGVKVSASRVVAGLSPSHLKGYGAESAAPPVVWLEKAVGRRGAVSFVENSQCRSGYWSIFVTIIIGLHLVGLPTEILGAENFSGSAQMTTTQTTTGKETRTTNMKRLALRYQRRLAQQRSVQLYGDLTRTDDSQLKYPNFRPNIGVNYQGAWYRVGSSLSKYDDKNYRKGTGKLSTSNQDVTLDLTPNRLPKVSASYRKSRNQDNLTPRRVDNQTVTSTVQVRQRIKYFDLYVSHVKTDYTDWVTGFSRWELSSFSTYAAASNDGTAYVSEADNDYLRRFTEQGGLLSTWGGSGGGPGQFRQPAGVAVDSAGNVYVVDAGNHRVQKFDASGNHLLSWGDGGTANGQFLSPTGIAVDSSGVYVVDSGNNRIQKFSTSGTYLGQWGAAGSGVGQFSFPRGIASNGTYVFVVDTGNNRIQRFDTSGGAAFMWGLPGTSNGAFNSPSGVTVDAAGFIYVTDTGNNRVQKFSNNGTYITQWRAGGSAPQGLSRPFGITVDTSGYIFVVDSGNRRIKKFASDGSFILETGEVVTKNKPQQQVTTNDTFSVGFSERPIRALTVSGQYQQFDTSLEVLSGTGTASTSSRRVTGLTSTLRLARPVSVTHSLTSDTYETEILGSITEQTNSANIVSLNISPHRDIDVIVSEGISQWRSSDGSLLETSTSDTTFIMRPRHDISWDVGFSRSTNTQDRVDTSSTSTLTTNAMLKVRRGIDVLVGQTWSESEDLIGGTVSQENTLKLDAFLQIHRRLNGILHFDLSRISTDTPGQELVTLSTQNSGLALQWQLSQVASIYGDFGVSTSNKSETTTKSLGFNWQFGRHHFRLTYDSTSTDLEKTDSIGQQFVFRFGKSTTLNTSMQQFISGENKGDGHLFIALTRSF